MNYTFNKIKDKVKDVSISWKDKLIPRSNSQLQDTIIDDHNIAMHDQLLLNHRAKLSKNLSIFEEIFKKLQICNKSRVELINCFSTLEQQGSLFLETYKNKIPHFNKQGQECLKSLNKFYQSSEGSCSKDEKEYHILNDILKILLSDIKCAIQAIDSVVKYKHKTVLVIIEKSKSLNDAKIKSDILKDYLKNLIDMNESLDNFTLQLMHDRFKILEKMSILTQFKFSNFYNPVLLNIIKS